MASLLEINGVAPNNVTVDGEPVKVVTYGDEWAVWAKFDDPETQPRVSPVTPYKVTSVSGISLLFTPTDKNPNTTRATGSLRLNMNSHQFDVTAYVERGINGIHSELVRTVWRFDVKLMRGNSVWQTLLQKENYAYDSNAMEFGMRRYLLNMGIRDTFTGSANEFVPYFEFKYVTPDLITPPQMIKQVEAQTKIVAKSSYLNGYPRYEYGGIGLNNIGDLSVGIAYIDE